ncbi:DNA polymerase sliding clamp [Natronosalvus amylolyticus]|uniref:DNA polymerase sliding clamp n=1 Tax=Natronosalvus amylolyticus TaxID=2961994 RepID=UPI0020C9CB06|nr:DNA polymerase sliding clamp [Natronosalvus amylolyticus]
MSSAVETETETDTETETEPEKTDETQPDLTTERGGFYCEAPVDVLEAYFEQFTEILDELRLQITMEGFEAGGVDPAQVAGIEHTLPKAAFDHYSSTGGLIGLDLGRITDVLSLAEHGDQATLELDQETRKLEIEIDGMEYTLSLIDPESVRKEVEVPDLDLPATIQIEGKALERGVKAADMVSDHIRFQVTGPDDDEPTFIISASGDTDDVHLELTDDELVDLESGAGDSLFSLDYLSDLVKGIPTNAVVTIHLGEEMPCILEFEHIERSDRGDRDDESAEGPYAEVTQFLAPRIAKD